MNRLRFLAQEQLLDAGYSVALAEHMDGSVLLFENNSVLGFVLCFPSAPTLLEQWREASHDVLQSAQFALRRADRKAWNAYLVLLAEAEGSYGENVMLSSIEEDLVGTRKIARAGIASAEDIGAALLPLLGIQNAPRLDTVDMAAEIRLRTTELPKELVDAYLSEASESALVQLLEIGP